MIYFIRTKLDPNFRSAQFIIIISFIELNIATIYLQVRSFWNWKKEMNTHLNFLFFRSAASVNSEDGVVDPAQYQTTNTGKKERVFYTNNNRKHLGQLRATAIAGNDITSSIFYTVSIIIEYNNAYGLRILIYSMSTQANNNLKGWCCNISCRKMDSCLYDSRYYRTYTIL